MKVLGSYQGAGGPSWRVDFTDLDEELRFLRQMVSGPPVPIGGQLIGEYRAHPVVRDLAVQIIRKTGARERDKKAQAIAIGQWVQDNIYYVHELPERFQTPTETLRTKAGDCDDQVVLIGSMLESIGIPVSLVCMRVDFSWKHIFPAAVMKDGALLPLDSTMKDYPVDALVNPTVYAQQRGKDVRIKLA